MRSSLSAGVVAMLAGIMPLSCGGDDEDHASSFPVTAASLTRPDTVLDKTSEATCEPRSVTITTDAQGSPVLPTLPGEGAAPASAIADTFCSPSWTLSYPDGTEEAVSPRPVLASDEARCIGDGLVDGLGAARVRELSVLGTGPWNLLAFALSNHQPGKQIERAEAEQMVDTFVECSPAWKQLLILSVTQGAGEISDKSTRCVTEQLTDDDARTMLVGEIDRAYDDPSQPDATPFAELIEPLVMVFNRCLSADERANLDFD